LGALVACGPSTSTTEAPSDVADGATLLEERCTICHGLNRVTQSQKTRDEWEQSVIRMVEQGARLDSDEQERLIDYLAETYGP